MNLFKGTSFHWLLLLYHTVKVKTDSWVALEDDEDDEDDVEDEEEEKEDTDIDADTEDRTLDVIYELFWTNLFKFVF